MICVTHCLSLFNFTNIPNPSDRNNPSFFDVVQTIGKNPEALSSPFDQRFSTGCRNDKVDILILEHAVNRTDPVDESFQLGIHGMKIDWRRQDHDITGE